MIRSGMVSSFRHDTFSNRKKRTFNSTECFFFFFYRVKRVSFRGFYLRYIKIKKKKKRERKQNEIKNERGEIYVENFFTLINFEIREPK